MKYKSILVLLVLVYCYQNIKISSKSRSEKVGKKGREQTDGDITEQSEEMTNESLEMEEESDSNQNTEVDSEQTKREFK